MFISMLFIIKRQFYFDEGKVSHAAAHHQHLGRNRAAATKVQDPGRGPEEFPQPGRGDQRKEPGGNRKTQNRKPAPQEREGLIHRQPQTAQAFHRPGAQPVCQHHRQLLAQGCELHAQGAGQVATRNQSQEASTVQSAGQAPGGVVEQAGANLGEPPHAEHQGAGEQTGQGDDQVQLGAVHPENLRGGGQET